MKPIFNVVLILLFVLFATPDVLAVGGDYNGVKIGADGRLIPSAYHKIKTFENGKTPLREVFVAPHGDDVRGNGSKNSPYKTIKKGLEFAAPGTAIRIMPGEYSESILRNDLYGTAENPIWIGGVPGMERPKMIHESAFLTVAGGSYVILHDMEVTQPPPHRPGRHGFNIYSGDGQIYKVPGDVTTINFEVLNNPEITHHIIFRNLYVHHIGDSPVKTAGVYTYWMFDCELAYGQQGLRGSGTLDNVGSHNALVAYNYLHHSIGHGIVFKGGSSNVDICHNLLIDYGVRGVQMGQSSGKVYFRPPLHVLPEDERYEAKHIRAYANIFIGGGYESEGRFLGSSAINFASSFNCFAVNNTVINPTGHLFRIHNNEIAFDPGHPTAPRLSHNGAARYGTVANNIFYYGKLTAEAINIGPDTEPETFTVSNNLFYNIENPDRIPDFGAVPHKNSIFGQDPLFEAFSAQNFALKANSPAIGAGIDLPFLKKDSSMFAFKDFEGRPFALPRSIGAFQTDCSKGVSVTENPTADWLFWDDFESGDLSRYDSYNKGGRNGPDQFILKRGVGLGGSQSMRAEFREVDGEQYITGGLQVYFGAVPPRSSAFKSVAAQNEYLTEVYARFYFKCDENWDFGGADKLCRMTSLQGSNYSQAMIAHLWSGGGGRPTGNYLYLDPASGVDITGGNARSLRENEPNFPPTNARLITTRYNDFTNLSWMRGKTIPIPFFDENHVGRWYCIEMRVKLNDPGQSNGIYEVWVDDVLQVSLTNLNWIGSCEVGPGKFYGINAFYLENYCNRGVKGVQVRYFDNLVVSRKKIGRATVTCVN